MKTVPVITIDGPSGTGKGTVAHRIAKTLGWHILDSGILYRALAYHAEKKGIVLNDESSLVHYAQSLPIQFQEADNDVFVFLNEEDVTNTLRTEVVGGLASQIAAFASVREALLQRQRDFLTPPGLVTDGRDMGTVVFPNATIKIFLDADVAERAKRRTRQLKGRSINVTLARVLSDFEARDRRDRTRAFAPLKAARDATIIDTTHLSVDEVYNLVAQVVKASGLYLGT